ncbi:unnamed protein product [Hermetia illucens]|uniref:Uncharacterized protein n=1 Tax=Hermetia illucens TaxID=343691 RepID=A0A7R8V6L0_HERIL|nr:unnamed protein product [Hermetia illucens]
MIPLSQQTLVIEKINSEMGYVEIKTDEIELVSNFDIVLHIIHPKDILDLVTKIELTINSIKPNINKNLATYQIESIKSCIRTLIPHKSKRGLINLGGTAMNWIFGTMDNDDRRNIEKHLTTIDQNTHNLIQNLNQQIKINNNFNKTLNLIRNAVESDRLAISNKINSITVAEERNFWQNLFLEQMIKLDLIKRQIETIQETISSARTGILFSNILTIEEIKNYDIDFNKLSNIKLGVAKYINDSIVLAIKIPTKTIKLDKKLLIPIATSDGKQIDQEPEYIIEFNNKTYYYQEAKSLKELFPSKNCIVKNNCKFIKSAQDELIEIGNDIVILNNMNNVKLNSSCDSRKTILAGNYFINFRNCTLQINDRIFSNKIVKYIKLELEIQEKVLKATEYYNNIIHDTTQYKPVGLINKEKLYEKLKSTKCKWINYQNRKREKQPEIEQKDIYIKNYTNESHKEQPKFRKVDVIKCKNVEILLVKNNRIRNKIHPERIKE